ncbi:MAG: (2Fe-2S)-binding protein [Planctomycetota bacterium]|nr:MAG: (2Fe-2S)-binding protein [Planctomycetota bacterium]
MHFQLNGKQVQVEAPPMKRLLDLLREEFGLTGTKEGCGEGECGACTVLLDGQPANACLIPVVQVKGRCVDTIESLQDQHPLLKSFVKENGSQCGICTPGMIMAASVIQAGASRREVQEALAGNLCRCTGYEAIFRAVKGAEL